MPAMIYSTRPVALPGIILAGFTLFLSTVGQAYVLLSASTMASRYPYISPTNMIGIFGSFLSTIGGYWLVALAKPEPILVDVERDPLLDDFVDKKRLKIELLPERRPPRCAKAIYLPYFIAGNICLGMSSLLWIREHFIAAQFALLVNLVIQNYAIFISLHDWNHPELSMGKRTWMTHVLSKGNAAIAILFLWKNSGILETLAAPTLPEMLSNGIIFVLMSIGGGPDPTLGFFLLYDLCVLAYGTGAAAEWRVAFQYTGLLVLFVLAWDMSKAPGEPEDIDGEIVLESGCHF